MKKYLFVFLIFVWWACIGYGMMAFQKWEFNPSFWIVRERFDVIRFWAIGALFTAWIPFVISDKKSHDTR